MLVVNLAHLQELEEVLAAEDATRVGVVCDVRSSARKRRVERAGLTESA
jgi:hypothetical protein